MKLSHPEVVDEVLKLMQPRELKLFTAGPVACFPEVLEVMRSQMLSHRSPEYSALHRDTVLRLAEFLEARRATVLLAPCSGTGFMEASIRNAVTPGGKVLVTSVGVFGDRYVEVVESNGRRAVVLRKPLGEPILPEELDEALRRNSDVEAVTVTHNETSTGVINPLKELAKVAKEREKLVFVDAVSSMGAADVRVDEWGLDIVFSSSQKAFGVPPGLAMAAVSEEVFEKAGKIIDRGWYFDLIALREDLIKGWSTPSTPPIPQVAGLNAALRIIEKIGGKNPWLEMHERRAGRVRSKVVELGLELFAKPGFYSPTITVVKTPMGLKSSDIYKSLRGRGFEIAMGYGPVKETTFRIGHMGYITDQDIDHLFKELSDVLRNLKRG